MRRTVMLVALLVAGCNAESGRFSGYVEGEYVRVAAPVAGRLLELSVARGGSVTVAQPLFTLEQEREHASVAEASGSIAAIRAQAQQARAQLKLAEANLKRVRELRAKGLAADEQVDEARTEHDRATARQREIEAQRQAAEAQLSQVQWQLAQKTVAAPVAGLVEDTLYRVGEWVPAGAPVVSLLPPENRLVRFFVPEAVVGTLAAGRGVTVHCDGCARPIAARVTYIAPQAEFTPPVIYSRDTRQKLVFLVEARPSAADAAGVHPGQPVEVELAP